MSRDEWFRTRSDFFSYSVNNELLDVIEKAVCFVRPSREDTLLYQNSLGLSRDKLDLVSGWIFGKDLVR